MLNDIKILSIEIIEEEVEVYDIGIKIDHSFIAEGIVVHNCIVCASDDGRTFEFKAGGGDHNGPMLPRHPFCRCCYIPWVKSWKELGSKVPEHTDPKLGLPFTGNSFPRQTYEQWLLKQPDNFQRDMLGPARYKLWKKGDFPLKEMVRDNRMLTIEELEKKVAELLKKASGKLNLDFIPPNANELLAIQGYTAQGGSLSNKFPFTKKEKETLENWLNKQPPSQQNVVSWRGMSFKESEWDKVWESWTIEGTEHTITSVQSFSLDPNRVLGYGKGGDITVKLKINSKYGVDISKYSVYPEEKEILFNKGIKFKITETDFGKGPWKGQVNVAAETLEKPKGLVAEKPMSSIGKFANCLISSIVEMMILEKVTPSPCSDYVRGDKGKWFLQDQIVVEKEVLKRLNNLGIPPAWKNVVVATNTEVKVQAIGLDQAGRWQYKYSAKHIEKAAQEKFNRLKLFSKNISKVRSGIEKGILDNDPRAYLLRMEDKTAIRVGSAKDFKAKKKAYGLTTLKNEHVIVKGDKVILDFVAKEGLPAHYEIEDKVLANWLSARKTVFKVGDDLFPDVSAKKLNDYLKEISGGDYTIKDFRTFHGTRIAYGELKQYAGKKLTSKEKKEIIKQVSEKASDFLHNTPTMARNSYIDPMVWDFIGGL